MRTTVCTAVLLAALLSALAPSAMAQEDPLAVLRAEALLQREALRAANETLDESPILWRDGHGGTVWARPSPDGERVLSVGEDRFVMLWDAWLGEPIAPLGLHRTAGVGHWFDPSGEVILIDDWATMSAGLWDGRSGDPLYSLDEEGELVEDAAFLDDARVVTVDATGVMRVWDTATGRLSSRAETGRRYRHIQALSKSWIPLKSARAGALLTRDVDSVVRTLDPTTGEVLRVLEHPSAQISSCGITGDGRVLTHSMGDGTLRVWPADGGAPRVYPCEPPGPLPDGLDALRSDPTRIVTVDGSGLYLLDADSGEAIAPLPTGDPLLRVAAGSAVYGVVYGGASTHVRVWRLHDAELLGAFQTSSSIATLEFFLDDRLLIGTSHGAYVMQEGKNPVQLQSHAPRLVGLDAGAGGQVFSGLWGNAPFGVGTGAFPTTSSMIARESARFWDARTGTRTASVDTAGARSCDAEFLDDGRAVVASTRGTLVVNREREVLGKLATNATAVVIGPAGRRALTLSFTPRDRAVRLWNLDGDRPTAEFVDIGGVGPHHDAPNGVFGLPDGALVATAHEDKKLRLWDSVDGALVREFEGHERNVCHLSTDPRRETLLSCSLDHTARLWDLVRLAAGPVLNGHTHSVWHGAFSPDGRTVATGSRDATARLWDARTGALLHELRGHAAAVRRVAFHPDGELLLTCSDDFTSRLWDIETGEVRAVLRGHVGPVQDGLFAYGGKRILTRADDATTRVWEAPSGRLLATHVEYSGDGWLTFTPGGYYVAGGGAADWARVSMHGETYPLSSYARTHEQPDLVIESLAGKDVGEPPQLKAPRLTLSVAPSGVVSERRVQVLGTIEAPHGIASVEVTLAGRLDDGSMSAPVALLEEDIAPGVREHGRGLSLVDLSVPFPDGWTEAVVRVRATSTRGIKSRVASLHRRYEPRSDASGRLFLLTLGVEDYDDDRLDLQYARDDVEDIVALFETVGANLFSEVRVEKLLDAEVNRAEINRVRHEFLYDAGPEDTIVVYVAGHGVLLRGEYYFLTTGDTPSKPYGGLTKDDLRKLVEWEGLESRRRLMLIDTCHAGESYGERGVSVQDAFTKDELRKNAGEGLYIVTASTEAGKAKEVEGNGLFTRVLLDALGGKADTDGDGVVDTAELISYATEHVKERGEQRVTTPRVEGGVPFPLTRVRE